MLHAKQEYERKPTDKLRRAIAKFNNIQMARKIQLNSAYGAIGNQYFRYYNLANAEAITLSGQVSIRWIENKVNKYLNNVLKTNILGVTNTLMPFIPYMKEQKSGSLVCISSVASYVPLPFHGGYTSSKIAIRMIFDSWRPTLQRHNIKTISICPGFVDTPIVKGPARKLPMKSPDKAAERFVKIISKGKNTYVYPWHYKILILIAKVIPEWLYNYVIKKIFHKPIN